VSKKKKNVGAQIRNIRSPISYEVHAKKKNLAKFLTFGNPIWEEEEDRQAAVISVGPNP
jgi:hypothetical protein